MGDPYDEAAEAIKKAKKVIAVTGAGASVESGIPDFRSPDGLWTKYPAEEYATIEAFHADPDKVWTMWHQLGVSLKDMRPNPGHIALAELEQLGHLNAVVTQNIDNLHQDAGNTMVIEYHGNAKRIYCTTCNRGDVFDPRQSEHGAPRCLCGGIMKPDVIFFGEAIPTEALYGADALARKCDAVIIVGTSATVYPAAGLPMIAKEHGAYIIECNLTKTDFTRTITDAFLQGPSGETLPRLVEQVKG